MKKTSIFLALSVFVLGAAYATETTYGDVSYGKETVDSIQNYGVVTLNGTTVSGKAQVDGRLEAVDTTFGSIQVKGKVNLKNCVVKNTTDIMGALTAVKSEFQGKITIASHEISFSGSKVGSILVKSDKEFQSTQIIEARDGTTIESVSFESGNGEVWLSDNSKVTAPVQGGKIVQK